MLKNYFTIAVRHLLRAKMFSFITLSGLMLGFTCFLLIMLYVNSELSFDKFHKDSNRVYRIVQQITEETGIERKTALVAPMIGPGIKEAFPEIEDMTRIISIGRITVGNDPARRGYETVSVPDTNFFSFFDFKLLQGNPKTALTESKGLVISESLALKYFNSKYSLGETLYSTFYDTKVSGVMADFPANSHLGIDMFVLPHEVGTIYQWWNDYVTTNWTENAFITYVKVKDGANINSLESKINNLVSKHYGTEKKFNGAFELQPITDIHLKSEGIEGGINKDAGKSYYVFLFLSVGFLVLLIASFNYMNLSTAAALERAREVGLRKTAGASRKQLIFQFLSETIMLSFAALLLSLLLVDLLLPYLNTFTEKDISFSLLDYRLWIVLVFLGLVTGIISGLYPAYLVTRVSPSAALKSVVKFGDNGFTLRKALVLSQFTIAIVMIIGTIVIYRQVNYLQEKDLGFEVENLITIDINSGSLRSNFESIKNEIDALSTVKSVTVSSRVPGEWKDFPLAEVRNSGNDKTGEMIFIGADKDFLKTYDISLVQGRNFTNAKADSTSVLINKAAVEALGIGNPVGHQIEMNRINWNGSMEDLETPYKATIIGVIDNFYFESFRQTLKPMLLGNHQNPIQNIDYYTVKIASVDMDKTLIQLAEINNRFDAENPIEYNFLDEKFQRFYKEDNRQGTLFLIFASVIVFISCMGLFALASFVIRHRKKEVGVRKVLGAKVSQIIFLIVKDFALMIGVAFCIASPIAYWFAKQWLSDFAYQTSLTWWTFVIGGILALGLALLTVSYLTLKAASANPVDSLKNE